MLMVIFGAGASYDSIAPRNRTGNLDERTFRPPLASELFEHRSAFDDALLRHPTISPVIDRLRHIAPGEYVEEVLEQIKAEAADYPINYRYLAAIQFYLRDAIYRVTDSWLRDESAGVTNYATLLGMLYEWQRTRSPKAPVALVTFNYDRMIDHALVPFSGRPRGINHHLDQPDFVLLKPHGSIDWFSAIEGVPRGSTHTDYEPSSQYLTENAPWRTTGRYLMLEDADPDLWRPDQWVTPLIAVPVQNKVGDSFAFPEAHLRKLRQLISSVTELLIIGWAGREKHFHELWKGMGAHVRKIVVVSGRLGAAEAVLLQLPVQHYWTDATDRVPLDGGFSEFVADRQKLREYFDGTEA